MSSETEALRYALPTSIWYLVDLEIEVASYGQQNSNGGELDDRCENVGVVSWFLGIPTSTETCFVPVYGTVAIFLDLEGPGRAYDVFTSWPWHECPGFIGH